MYLGYQNGKIKYCTPEPLDAYMYMLDATEYTEDEYVLDGEEYVLNDDEYKARAALKEAERIGHLKLTGADVERGIYKAKGLDFDDIIAMIEAMQDSSIDVKALKIELKANHFYRGNPFVEAVGAILGFTKEQMDKFFETGDYNHLIS